MSFYARFEKYDDCLLRFDTRVYLNGTPQPQKDGKCVAAVIGKNPGSAKPSNGSEWQALDLDGDKHATGKLTNALTFRFHRWRTSES